jgi:hypothetical protein
LQIFAAKKLPRKAAKLVLMWVAIASMFFEIAAGRFNSIWANNPMNTSESSYKKRSDIEHAQRAQCSPNLNSVPNPSWLG